MASRLWIIGFLAVVLAVVSALPLGQRIERSLGLGVLYAMRGPVEAPGGAIVVALDAESISWLERNIDDLADVSDGLAPCLTESAAREMKLSRNVFRYPRAFHACLVTLLAERGARLIAFDIGFNATTEDDAMFADRIRAAGNVLLLEMVTSDGLYRIKTPAPVLTDAAAGTVIFQTDGVEGRTTTGYPTVLRHVPGARMMPIEAWERTARADGASAIDWPAFQAVWFYGPPLSVPTYAIRDVFDPGALNPLPMDLSGLVVFVGAADVVRPGAYDHFAMPEVALDAARIGGVEIAATAYLNAVHDQRLAALGLDLRAVLTFAIVLAIGVPAALSSVVPGIAMALLVAGGAVAGSYAAFVLGPLWAPVAVPVGLGVPLVFGAVLLMRYVTVRGMILRLVPRQFAERLLVRGGAEARVETEDASVMFVDIVGSTVLAGRISLDGFREIMQSYYASAKTAIEGHGGMVIEFKGDGVLAIFSRSVTGPDHAAGACRAALELSARVSSIGLGPECPMDERLRLRIGVHTGVVATGPIGTADRFNFNAMGDDVHIAHRLEQQGRHAGQSGGDAILISGETLAAAASARPATELAGVHSFRGVDNPQTTEAHRLLGISV